MKMKPDPLRTPKHERTQLEQDFRDKAANTSAPPRNCEYPSSEALYTTVSI